jgi:hypothetical protein
MNTFIQPRTLVVVVLPGAGLFAITDRSKRAKRLKGENAHDAHDKSFPFRAHNFVVGSLSALRTHSGSRRYELLGPDRWRTNRDHYQRQRHRTGWRVMHAQLRQHRGKRGGRTERNPRRLRLHGAVRDRLRSADYSQRSPGDAAPDRRCGAIRARTKLCSVIAARPHRTR